MKKVASSLFSLLAAVVVGMVSFPAAAASVPSPFALSSQIVHGAELCKVAQRAASHLLPDANHVLVAVGSADQSVPAGHLQISAEPIQAYGSTYLNVPLTIRVNGTVVRTVYAGFRIVTYVMRSQAAHTLNAGHVLEAADFTSVRVADTGAQTTDVQTLVGRSLVTTVAAGQPVTLWQTTLPIVVHSGDPCVLVIRDGPVALAADVVARSSGGIGESVSVYDEREDHTMNAVVVAPGQVEVRLTEVGNS